MSYCEDYIDPFPRDCEHGVPDGINCDDCVDEAMEDDQENAVSSDAEQLKKLAVHALRTYVKPV